MILFLPFFWGGGGYCSLVGLQCVFQGKVIQLCVYLYMHTYIPFQIFLHYRLLQDTEYSFLYYTVGPCLSVLYIVVCIIIV